MKRSSLLPWLAATLFWTFVGFLYFAQVWSLARLRPANPPVQFLATYVWQGAFYGLWIPLTVLVWRVTKTWEPGALGWPKLLGRHLVFGAAICLVQSGLVVAFGFAVLGLGNESVQTALVNQTRGRLYQQVVIYTAIVTAGQAIALYERWRTRDLQAAQLETQLAAARLESLRAQLHPHFLFNSLHTIASLVRDERNDDAVRLISALGDLLRRVLDSGDQQLPLGEEVDLLRRYVDIQTARFGDRLRVTIEVDASLHDARVPALLIQPLVENAIRHGLSLAPEGGSIDVSISRNGDDLVMNVDDTGQGVPAGWTVDGTSGTGLRNLKDRLAALYGPRAVLKAGSRSGGGFSVRASLPIQRAAS